MYRPLALLLLLVLAAAPASGQLAANDGGSAADRRRAFQAQLDDIRSMISAAEKELDRTKTQESASLQALTRLNRDIALREEIVGNYEVRITQLTAERDSVFQQVQTLSHEIEQLREEYRARATHAYKYGRLHDLALIFSANSINQMLVRVNYLSRFSDARKQQVDDIRRTTAALEDHRAHLVATLAHTEETLTAARREREQLFDQKRERQRVVQALRREKTKLEDQLAERRTAERNLAERLESLIAEERRRALAGGAGEFNAAEYAALTGSFETNRGRLPWPAQGTVVERFGVHVNAEYGTRTTNQGIVVATSPEADVRSVFEGRVIGIDVMPVYGKYVMVSHGDYVTVYGNLSKVYVTAQQTLVAGQLVGKAGTDQDPYGAGYFFGLSKDGFVDPAVWLR